MPAPFSIVRHRTRSRLGRLAGSLLAVAFLAWSLGSVAPARAAASPVPAIEAPGGSAGLGHHGPVAPDPVDVAEGNLENVGEATEGSTADHFGSEAISAAAADALALAGGERAAGWLSFLPGTCHSRLAEGPSPYRGPPSF